MDGPLPLPSADPTAPTGPVATPGGPVESAADAPTAATFAALLQLARLSSDDLAEESAVDDAAQPGAETPVANALDGLLFLANVMAPPTAGQAGDTTPTDSHADPATNATAPENGVTLPLAAALPAAAREASTPSPADASQSRLVPAAVDVDAARAASKQGAFVQEAHAALKGETALEFRSATKDALSPVAPVTASGEPAAIMPAMPAATTPAPVSVSIDAPVRHPQFADEAAERIVSLVTRGVERAELRMSPAELGPVEVRIDVRGGEATVAIVAAQSTTRDALEQALPLLRDLLAQQGLALGEATVRDGRTDGEPAPRDGFARAGDASADPLDDAPAMAVRVTAGPRRLVDVFA